MEPEEWSPVNAASTEFLLFVVLRFAWEGKVVAVRERTA